MITSRDIKHLLPPVQKLALKLIAAAKAVGIDLLITSTLRDVEAQNVLYAKGRTTPGPRVTNARGGDSYHQYGVAFDVVPLVNGKAVWNDAAAWAKIGKLGTDLGLEWAGNWKRFKEMPHFQYTQGLTIQDFKSGKTLP